MLVFMLFPMEKMQNLIFAIFDNNVWFGVRERVWSVSWLCATEKEPHTTSNTHFLDENGHITNDWWHTIEVRWTMHGNMYQPFVQPVHVPDRRCSNWLFCVLFRLPPDLRHGFSPQKTGSCCCLSVGAVLLALRSVSPAFFLNRNVKISNMGNCIKCRCVVEFSLDFKWMPT